MSTDPQGSTGGDVNLAPPSHAMRWVVIAVLVVVAVAAFLIYNGAANKNDDKKLARFDAFRAAYAEKCNVPSYANTQPDVINNDYLTSPGIQAEVDRQLAALNAGGSCADVVAKLKAVDLHVPEPNPAQ